MKHKVCNKGSALTGRQAPREKQSIISCAGYLLDLLALRGLWNAPTVCHI